jgi:lysophospholipid acyltransferase (LPLAT)-like uncharacterized protein
MLVEDAPTKRSGLVTPHQPRWFQRLGASLVFFLENALTTTLRFKWEDHTTLFCGSPQPVIFCVWHNRLALSMAIWRGYPRKRQPGRRLAALISASKDGAFLAAVLERFDVQPVRGSTSRRGPQALLELTGWAERGYDLAITPDGPRGPRYIVKDGVVALAQLTGLPIVPVTCFFHRKVCMRSWDVFQIPLPFSKCDVVFGKPLVIPREAPDSEREELRAQLQKVMREISRD